MWDTACTVLSIFATIFIIYVGNYLVISTHLLGQAHGHEGAWLDSLPNMIARYNDPNLNRLKNEPIVLLRYDINLNNRQNVEALLEYTDHCRRAVVRIQLVRNRVKMYTIGFLGCVLSTVIVCRPILDGGIPLISGLAVLPVFGVIFPVLLIGFISSPHSFSWSKFQAHKSAIAAATNTDLQRVFP